MAKIYKNQTKVTVQVTIKDNAGDIMDLSADTAVIKYEKPSGIRGELVPTDPSPATGLLTFTVVDPSFLNEAGNWLFWGFVLFADGKHAAGEPFAYKIYHEGQ